MLTQAVVFIVAAIGALKTSKRLLEIAEEVKAKTLPAIEKTQSVLHDLHPKVRTLTDNLVETSHVVRSKAQEFDSTLSEVNQRARVQTARVDDMVSSVLDTTAGIASTIQKGVSVPVREFNGLMNGLRAGIDVLIGRRGNHAPHATAPESSPSGTTRPFDSGAKPFGTAAAPYRDDAGI
jgi:2-succinyl-5-enolpyruvyl-6-hydroxy-3-cyclohexene-1-carboxylate synthase